MPNTLPGSPAECVEHLVQFTEEGLFQGNLAWTSISTAWIEIDGERGMHLFIHPINIQQVYHVDQVQKLISEKHP